jgi:uncharacterized glyoxalase superfamily protein PhnB
MPSSTVIPVLHYEDVRATVDWLQRAFGFEERLAIADHRSQMMWAGGALVVAEAAASTHPGAHSVMVRVTDIDAHCARARSAGARIVQEPATYPHGERQYTAVDPGGHAWTFSESVADVDPASWGGTLLA